MWELGQIPHTMVKFTERQILQEFMLEEEIELWGIHKGKMVERCIDRETVDPPEMSVRIAYELEECIEEEICNMSLPKLYRAEGSVHTDEIKLDTPKMNVVEINELPKDVKLVIAIEHIVSKTMQNVSLVSDIPIPFMQYHAETF